GLEFAKSQRRGEMQESACQVIGGAQRPSRLMDKIQQSRQGCLVSPTLFQIFLQRMITDASEDHEGTVSTGGRTITNLRFADDIDGLKKNDKIS
uniref:hypothetical protein n=1 Tax=Thiolapillus sp. TaxID=2017437 RepID=UPI003AF6C160